MKKERLLSLLAGIALVLGFFLTWISLPAFFGGSLSGFSIVQAAFSESDGMLTGILLSLIPLGGIGLIAYALMPIENGMLRKISSGIVVAVFLYGLIMFLIKAGKEGFDGLRMTLNFLGIGFYLTFVGIILSIIDFIKAMKSKPAESPNLD